ncbi:hypothetical protein [Oceaniradius stylonematis]|uniref:hypothetical protein n=1 Tax=Oceaniradius stylonematis TaxID=2184161 RepID=UPI003B798D83
MHGAAVDRRVDDAGIQTQTLGTGVAQGPRLDARNAEGGGSGDERTVALLDREGDIAIERGAGETAAS